MAFAANADAASAEAKAEAEQARWREQLLAARQAPAAGAPTARVATLAANRNGLGLPNGHS